MAYRELELTLVSAQDLKNVNLITRMDVYAVVSISGDPLTRQCTEPDAYGGRNPCWNETFRFAVPPTAAAAAAAGASLHVLLRAERFLGDRDVGEVVVPLADILAGATGPGPQPPHVASYQVRKLHRWEPRGVLNVSYRLGPVVAPVVVDNKPAVSVYAPVCVPPQPSHPHPSSPVTYQAPPAPAPGRPAVRVAVAAEHDEAAAQNKSPVMAYPVVVPQQPSPRPPAKPADAYRQPPPPSSPRPAAVHHATGHEEARRAPTPPPAPPTAPRTTNARNNNGLGQPGTTHVYVGPQTQIFFGSGGPTTTAGPPTTWTTTTSPARSTISPAGKKGDGNWALPPHDTYASAAAAESVSMSVVSPRSRKEDHRWRPSGPSPSQQQAASSPVAAPSHHLAASPFSSRTSSSSSPSSPYSAHPSPSSSSSAHSSNRSPYTSSPHPSTATSPHPPLRSPAVSGAAEVTHGTNNGFRSTSFSRPPAVGGAAEVSQGTNNGFRSTSSRGGGAAISSPLPLSSPMAPNHSSVVH